MDYIYWFIAGIIFAVACFYAWIYGFYEWIMSFFCEEDEENEN
jgi:hypothetical protein